MELNHRRVGAGDPLILIHGTGSQWQIWRPLIDRLAPHRDVIAVDLPGHGDTPPLPARVMGARDHADAVERFLDDLGIDRPAVLGNSLGGTVGLELARRGRVASVVALAPAGFWTPREQRWCVSRLRADRQAARAWVARGLPLVDNAVVRTLAMGGLIGRGWDMPPDAVREATLNLANAPGFDATNDGWLDYVFAGGDDIDVPVTILWGTRDLLLFPRQAPRAERVIPGARLVWLKGAGHVPTWDAPEEIARAALAS